MATIYINVLLTLIGMTSAKIGFVKDLGMDAEFPPQIIKANRRVPDGHLRPLGYQNSPEHPVEDYEGVVTAGEMYWDYLKVGKPVVFRNSIVDFPIFETWATDDHLRKNYGKLNVSVVTRKGSKRDYLMRGRKSMKLSKFLLDYLYEDWFLAGTVPQVLMHELPLPKCVQCGSVANYLQEAELWMSSGGTSSTLHSHSDHNLHCVLFGRRDFILIENQYKDAFEYKAEFPGSTAGHSPLDMDFINVLKYKKIAKTPWTWATLHQGDCILVPAGYLHQVRSHGRSISITILITPTPTFDSKGCDIKQYKKARTLSDAAFIWSFEGGQRVLTNWRLNAESVRYLLLAEIRNRDVLPVEQFIILYDNIMVVSTDETIHGAAVYAMLFETGTREVTRNDILNLSTQKLERVAKVFNKPYENNPRVKIDHEHREL